MRCFKCGEKFSPGDVACHGCGKSLVDHGLFDNPRRSAGIWVISVYLIGMTGLGLIGSLSVLWMEELVTSLVGPDDAFVGMFAHVGELLPLTIVQSLVLIAAGIAAFFLRKAALPLLVVGFLVSSAVFFQFLRIDVPEPIRSQTISSAIFNLVLLAAILAYLFHARRNGVFERPTTEPRREDSWEL